MATAKSKAEKIMNKKFITYIIFDNISEDLDDYRKPDIVPLYISLTEEEAIEACFKLLYIKHIDHYSLWCELHGLKMGDSEESWQKYVEDVLQGRDHALTDEFKIVCSTHTYGEIISILRSFMGTVAILGFPSETPAETLSFLERAELDETTADSKEPQLLPADKTNDPVAATLVNVMKCRDVGEYTGKFFASVPEEFPEVRSKCLEAASSDKVPAKSRATYLRAIKVADELLSHSKKEE